MICKAGPRGMTADQPMENWDEATVRNIWWGRANPKLPRLRILFLTQNLSVSPKFLRWSMIRPFQNQVLVFHLIFSEVFFKWLNSPFDIVPKIFHVTWIHRRRITVICRAVWFSSCDLGRKGEEFGCSAAFYWDGDEQNGIWLSIFWIFYALEFLTQFQCRMPNPCYDWTSVWQMYCGS